MQTQVAPQLNVAKNLLANLAAELVAGINGAGSAADMLQAATTVQAELDGAASALQVVMTEAKAAVAARAAEVRAAMDEAALVRIVEMLDAGSLTLAGIASRMAVPPVAPVVSLVAVTPPVVPAAAVEAPVAAPAPVVITPKLAQPQVDANGDALSPEVRENLRLQKGYMFPVKYRDPVSGAGWSGRGPMPKWLKALLVDGKSLADFAATAESAAAPAAEPAPVASATEVATEVAAPAAAAIDIGSEVASFDASDMDDDLSVKAGGEHDDIGEIVIDIAQMPLGGTQAFLVAA